MPGSLVPSPALLRLEHRLSSARRLLQVSYALHSTQSRLDISVAAL